MMRDEIKKVKPHLFGKHDCGEEMGQFNTSKAFWDAWISKEVCMITIIKGQWNRERVKIWPQFMLHRQAFNLL